MPSSLRDPLLLSILAALFSSCGSDDGADLIEKKVCASVDDAVTQCVAAEQVPLESLFVPWNCEVKVVAAHGAGTHDKVTGQDGVTSDVCCYDGEVKVENPGCVIGRPYRESAGITVARTQAQGETDASARAQAWALAGAAEHASVASFARLSLQLMAHAAPTDLVLAAHEAACDEVRHANACWTLAQRFGMAAVTAEAFPFREPIAVNGSLAELAADAAREGCVNETLGAFAAREAAGLSAEPEVARVLLSLADDEARHAVLAYRIVDWALSIGGSEVRAAVNAALESRRERLDTRELAVRAGLDPAQLAATERRGLDRVVRPALSALLEARA
ncbi:MAG TPA: ferritin-like domain-containing protein [Polyangiaceae bacterium]|nr:ferritin-like domain-containing protein [Polyangiaceae bacterium]